MLILSWDISLHQLSLVTRRYSSCNSFSAPDLAFTLKYQFSQRFCTSLLICPSLVAQWLEHLPRLQKVSGSIPGLGKNFSTFVTSVARKSSGQLARKMIVVRPCINAWQRPWRSPASVGKLLKSLRGPLDIHKQGLQPPLSQKQSINSIVGNPVWFKMFQKLLINSLNTLQHNTYMPPRG